MKKLIINKRLLAFNFLIVFTMIFAACTKNTKSTDLWKNAVYTADTVLGEGDKTVKVTVAAEDKSIVFTLKTDAETLGEALVENEIVSGKKEVYGLYIKKVNGIEADYDKTKTYWAITKQGEYMSTGADGEKISGGESYELTYTKG